MKSDCVSIKELASDFCSRVTTGGHELTRKCPVLYQLCSEITGEFLRFEDCKELKSMLQNVFHTIYKDFCNQFSSTYSRCIPGYIVAESYMSFTSIQMFFDKIVDGLTLESLKTLKIQLEDGSSNFMEEFLSYIVDKQFKFDPKVQCELVHQVLKRFICEIETNVRFYLGQTSFELSVLRYFTTLDEKVYCDSKFVSDRNSEFTLFIARLKALVFEEVGTMECKGCAFQILSKIMWTRSDLLQDDFVSF